MTSMESYGDPFEIFYSFSRFATIGTSFIEERVLFGKNVVDPS
jgi:hypothetical protein